MGKTLYQNKTLYQKLYDAHIVYEAPNETPLLYIDRHLVHEVTSPQAFDGLRAMGRPVRQPVKPLPPWITTFRHKPKISMPVVKWPAFRCRNLSRTVLNSACLCMT